MYCELAKFGHLLELHVSLLLRWTCHHTANDVSQVCDNVGDHLIGNVYARYEWETEAQAAVDNLNDRWYAGVFWNMQSLVSVLTWCHQAVHCTPNYHRSQTSVRHVAVKTRMESATVGASAILCISGLRPRILSSLFKPASAWNGDCTLHRPPVAEGGNHRRGKGVSAAHPLAKVVMTVKTDGLGNESGSESGWSFPLRCVNLVILLSRAETLSAYGSSCM